MTKEIWKDIPNYEGYYQVSNIGRIKSLNYRNTKTPKVLKASTENGSGYLFVTLVKKSKRKVRTVHQLVSEAFLNHKPNGNKLVVNHKDFNKLNNNASNLDIITARENSNRKHIKSSSKYVGVSWAKRNNKWQSNIYINGNLEYLGYFTNETDAHNAYQKALNEYI